MYLKSLEINGFKSFGKKSVLEFTSPITSVVGPNGSGKSNVAESFRFVLGEQSLKSMRGKKGEDLIFSGSDQGGKLNRASVKVVFNNSQRLLPIDFDEVSIERVVHRDGGNDYFINGSPVRLKDIQELLSHAHIGASGHHIISQGEADRILMSNLKDRRSMIEDALGLKIYQYKKIESEKKLDKTEENLKQVESLRRELAPHLKFLRKQVEKIEKAEELRKDLVEKYKEYFKREEMYLVNAREHIDSAIHAPESELHDLSNKLEIIKEKLNVGEGNNQTKLDLIRFEEELRKVIDEKQRASHALGRLEGEISSISRMLERTKQKAQESGNTTVYLRDVESLINEVKIEINNAESSGAMETIRHMLAKVRGLFNSFLEAHRTKTDSNEYVQYEEDLQKLGAEKKRYEESLIVFSENETQLHSRINDLKLEIEKEKEGNRDAEREMFEIMQRQTVLQGEISLLRSKRNNLQIEEDEFKRELGEVCLVVDREISKYKMLIVPEENILNEDRTVQHERKRQLEKLKIRLEELGLGSADDVMKEFKETEERDLFLEKEITDLIKSSEDLKLLIKDLDNRINIEFKLGIEKINTEFQKYFELLFGGGRASLKVVKEEKRKKSDTDLEMSEEIPEEESPEGIDIAVDLPKKKVKGLMMLSGGERALTSIALLFAMSQVNPPPFIILDETDAALDEANSKKYGDMVENLASRSQLIVITHNRETMSRAGVLYGVTMLSGVSKLLSIKFDEAVQVAK